MVDGFAAAAFHALIHTGYGAVVADEHGGDEELLKKIADDVLEAVFEPFVQEDARVNREYGGTGLGLAIAHRLARQMDGGLSAASVKGEGSTFTLTLPCR